MTSLSTPVGLPQTSELRLLKALLSASQPLWLSQFERWADEPTYRVAEQCVKLPWPTSLLSREGQSVYFSVSRLYRCGWLPTLRMGQSGLEAALPMTLPMALESATLPENMDNDPHLKAFVRLLELHQQQLLACVTGGLDHSPSPSLEVLFVGREVPVELAEALHREGLAYCYRPDYGRAQYGEAAEPVEGVAITLTVQDAELAKSLADGLRPSDPQVQSGTE